MTTIFADEAVTIATSTEPGPRIVAESRGMLCAALVPLQSFPVLTVYRSALVKENSELYKPVADFLAENQHEELVSTEVEDDHVIGGAAVRTFYRIHQAS